MDILKFLIEDNVSKNNKKLDLLTKCQKGNVYMYKIVVNQQL